MSFYLNLVSHYWNHSSKKQSFKGKSFLALQLSLFNKVVSLLGLHLGFSGCDSIDWFYIFKVTPANFKLVSIKNLMKSVVQNKIFIKKIWKVFLLKGGLNHIIIVYQVFSFTVFTVLYFTLVINPALGNRSFPVRVRSLAIWTKGLSVAIDRLMSTCSQSGWNW